MNTTDPGSLKGPSYTNGSCLAYWGSIEYLNGATVISDSPCYCGKCLGEAAHGDGVWRREVRIEWRGSTETLRHVHPDHLH